MANIWVVLIGNIGTVYTGANGFEAVKTYNEFIAISKAPHGRAAGETVTLFKNNDIHKEHIGEF